MEELEKVTLGKLKAIKKLSKEAEPNMLDIQQQLESMDFDSRIDGKVLIAYRGALSFEIRFTTEGNKIITKHGGRLQLGHDDKLDQEKTIDYLSTRIAQYMSEK